MLIINVIVNNNDNDIDNGSKIIRQRE